MHKNKYHIRNQHGRFSGNRCAYCHIYHGEILNFKCLLRHFCATLIYQTKCVTMYIVFHTILVKLQSNQTWLGTTRNTHLGHALAASKYNTAIFNQNPNIQVFKHIISIQMKTKCGEYLKIITGFEQKLDSGNSIDLTISSLLPAIECHGYNF